MRYTIENSNITVIIESFGAELVSLINEANKKEYIWQKNSKFWGKSSPILFPFIGSLKNEKYIYENKEYKLSAKHGFARDNEFKVFDKGKNFIEFLFESNKETLKEYPFEFKLFLKYSILEKNLKITYKVVNNSKGIMYFSLGAHPAFNILEEETHQIEFEKDEIGNTKLLKGSFIDGEKTREIFKGKLFNLNKNGLEEDTIILENTNSKKIWIKNNKNDKILEIEYEGFKYLAFWNIPNSGFICVEPWDGLPDCYNTDGELTDKVGIQKLYENEEYSKDINIKIL